MGTPQKLTNDSDDDDCSVEGLEATRNVRLEFVAQ